MRHGLTCLLVSLLAIGVLVMGPEPTVAEDPVYEEYSAPVYFMISFDETFVVRHPKESQTIVVNVGTLVGGGDVFDTRFVVNTSLQGITLPDGRKDPTFEELQNNAATVLGSFYALDEQGFHTVVPTPGEVDPEIQEAVFQASNLGAIDDLLVEEPFPTTEDIAEVIVSFLPPGSLYGKEDVYDHVFGSAIQLSLAEGEGEMFPHEPNSEALFSFVFRFTEDETFEQDVRFEVPVEMQSPVNVESKTGVLPVTLRSSTKFDVGDVSIATLEIGGVAVNDGQSTWTGNDALVVKFSVPKLVAAGALTAGTTSLTVRGALTDGSLFFGTDEITVSSSN